VTRWLDGAQIQISFGDFKNSLFASLTLEQVLAHTLSFDWIFAMRTPDVTHGVVSATIETGADSRIDIVGHRRAPLLVYGQYTPVLLILQYVFFRRVLQRPPLAYSLPRAV
jgi:hypothetical protein